MAAFKRRVTIVLVPLIGLGSDQVQKSCYYYHNFEVHHLDEHKGQDAYDLRDRILLMEEKEMGCTSIFLICSPSVVGQTPGETTRGWVGLIHTLAKRGHISQICIDEAHSVEQSGRNFRPEFVDAVKNIRAFVECSPRHISTIAMSATLQQIDRGRISILLGMSNPTIIYGPLGRRGTSFQCIVTGSTSTSTKSSYKVDLNADPDHHAVLYTNSKTNAEGPLFEIATALLEQNQRTGGLQLLLLIHSREAMASNVKHAQWRL